MGGVSTVEDVRDDIAESEPYMTTGSGEEFRTDHAAMQRAAINFF
jgi:hypothetical protein